MAPTAEGEEAAAAAAAAADAGGGAAPAPPPPLVLILTPVKNALRHLPRYLRNVRSLAYPRERLALALMDSDSDDVPSAAAAAAVAALAANGSLGDFDGSGGGWRHTATLYALLAALPELRRDFRAASVVQHNFGLAAPAAESRHAEGFQLRRRAALARSRNHLLLSALRDEAWVLWIDADVAEFPADVLQSLLAARRDIVVPNVVMAPGGRSYDLNSWRARELGDNASLAAVVAHHDALHAAESRAGRPHALHLEGYGGGGAHIYLHQMRGGGGGGGGAVVRRLDAVGGAMLLVNAELHRHGLVFPPFVYRHRIETEGLSMMALDMGVLSWGMPAVEVIHH